MLMSAADRRLRLAAFERIRRLAEHFDDIIPLAALRAGFEVDRARVSFGSFYNGIFRPKEMEGRAALALVTSFNSPYLDDLDAADGSVLYHYRAAALDHRDNVALRAAFSEQAPLVYFHALAPGQYLAHAPFFVLEDDPQQRVVRLEAALPVADTGAAGLVSPPDVRAYALADVKRRLHQQGFRLRVLRAYRERCAVCSLKQPELVQAAHIVEDSALGGVATVVNGLALCAIHHLAYDRNLMGIDPGGVVHIARRLLDEQDGPMLRAGLQGFHGEAIVQPRSAAQRPDPERLEVRYERFRDAAA